MSEKAIVFIDGSWLYKSRTTLFEKLGEENFEIDYARLPKILCEEVANYLDEDISLVKIMYFSTIPSSRSGFNTSKQYAFYDFLEKNCYYDTFIYEVDVANEEYKTQSTWVDVSLASNLVYYAALPSVMDIAIVIGDSSNLSPAIKKVRSLGKRVQLVSVKNEAAENEKKSRISDFKTIYLEDYAAEMKLVREKIVRTCKKCRNEEETTWAGVDFFCSSCRGKFRG